MTILVATASNHSSTFDPPKLGVVERLTVTMVKAPDGDFRDRR